MASCLPLVVAILFESVRLSSSNLAEEKCLLNRLDVLNCTFGNSTTALIPSENEVGVYTTEIRRGHEGIPECQIHRHDQIILPIETQDISDSRGQHTATLISPGYPAQYNNNLFVVYNISCPPGHVALFTLDDIELEPANCLDSLSETFRCRDYVTVVDHGLEFCGNDTVGLMAVLPDQFSVVFRTSPEKRFGGFSASVLCYEPQLVIVTDEQIIAALRDSTMFNPVVAARNAAQTIIDFMKMTQPVRLENLRQGITVEQTTETLPSGSGLAHCIIETVGPIAFVSCFSNRSNVTVQSVYIDGNQTGILTPFQFDMDDLRQFSLSLSNDYYHHGTLAYSLLDHVTGETDEVLLPLRLEKCGIFISVVGPQFSSPELEVHCSGDNSDVVTATCTVDEQQPLECRYPMFSFSISPDEFSLGMHTVEMSFFILIKNLNRISLRNHMILIPFTVWVREECAGEISFSCTNYIQDRRSCALNKDLPLFCYLPCNVCDLYSECVINGTTFELACTCYDGYIGIGSECVDIDECAQGVDNCNESATCLNMKGNFSCHCKEGFYGNGVACIDFDECEAHIHNCHANATCTNTDGSFECTCHDGYTGNGVVCFNESTLDHSATCQSGTDFCFCLEDNTMNCFCLQGYRSNSSMRCEDVNECEENKDECSDTCFNSIGSYLCGCERGFLLDSDERTCKDINECTTGLHYCDSNADCNNTVGSFICTCRQGYHGDGRRCFRRLMNEETIACQQLTINDEVIQGKVTCGSCYRGYKFDENTFECADIDECEFHSHDVCDHNAVCRNLIGSFDCTCKDGFYGNGFSQCLDMDECVSGLHQCHPERAYCMNTIGSYECTCFDGYFGNGFDCSVGVAPVLLTEHSDGPNHELEYNINNNFCLESLTEQMHFIIYCVSETNAPPPTVQWFFETGSEDYVNATDFLGFIDNMQYALSLDTSGISQIMEVLSVDVLTVNCTLTNDFGEVEGSTEISQCAPTECQDGITNNCSQICRRLGSEHLCDCWEGFQLKDDGTTCEDIDECLVGQPCDNSTEECVNHMITDKGDLPFECVCKPGYDMNEGNCSNIDECTHGWSYCDFHANCMDTIGSFECSCLPGFEGDGIFCEDINECEVDNRVCDENAGCNNTDGGYECTSCHPGFSGNGTFCEDIDECALGLTNCSYCQNNLGGFECVCPSAFQLKSDGKTCEVKPIVLAFGIIGGLALLLVCIVLTVLLVWQCYKSCRELCKTYAVKRRISKDNIYSDKEAVPETKNINRLRRFRVQSSMKLDIPRELVVHSSNLEILETIGQGEFGIVYKAHLLKDLGRTVIAIVAVKTLKGFLNEALVKGLLKECLKMKRFNHPNVLTLTGVCMDGGPTPFLVMPFMANGSLHSYLRKNRCHLVIDEESETKPQALSRLMDMCIQVAKGMEYLAAEKFVHRDLAARNCMIDVNYVIKVADFGLAEHLESKDYFRQDKGSEIKLPVKWLAPESLMDYVFSEKSDVWAYGVTCWEIFSGGKAPYAGDNPSNLPKMLESGYRMERPQNAACSEEMYSMMMHCWNFCPNDRPTFSDIVSRLSASLETLAGYLDIGTFHNDQSNMSNVNSVTKSVCECNEAESQPVELISVTFQRPDLTQPATQPQSGIVSDLQIQQETNV